MSNEKKKKTEYIFCHAFRCKSVFFFIKWKFFNLIILRLDKIWQKRN